MEMSGTAIQCCKSSTHVVFNLAHSRRLQSVSSSSYLAALKALEHSINDVYSCCNIKLRLQSVLVFFYNSQKISDFFFKHLYALVFITVTQCVCCAEGNEHVYHLDRLRVSKGYVMSCQYGPVWCTVAALQKKSNAPVWYTYLDLIQQNDHRFKSFEKFMAWYFLVCNEYSQWKKNTVLRNAALISFQRNSPISLKVSLPFLFIYFFLCSNFFYIYAINSKLINFYLP
jgi:hypothetical protein